LGKETARRNETDTEVYAVVPLLQHTGPMYQLPEEITLPSRDGKNARLFRTKRFPYHSAMEVYNENPEFCSKALNQRINSFLRTLDIPDVAYQIRIYTDERTEGYVKLRGDQAKAWVELVEFLANYMEFHEKNEFAKGKNMLINLVRKEITMDDFTG
jgi:hypothetical protein